MASSVGGLLTSKNCRVKAHRCSAEGCQMQDAGRQADALNANAVRSMAQDEPSDPLANASAKDTPPLPRELQRHKPPDSCKPRSTKRR